jgi:hypothetical protein
VAAPVIWAALDTVVRVVNDTTGATVGVEPGGAGRIQARVGNLPSNPVTVVAQAPLDSIRAVGDTADTVIVSGTPPDTLSDSLVVRVFADPPARPAPRMTEAQALIRRRFTYAVELSPPVGATVTLVPNDTGFTNTSGIVAVQVRLEAGALPVSVRVTARSARLVTTPPDSITFVVEFRP